MSTGNNYKVASKVRTPQQQLLIARTKNLVSGSNADGTLTDDEFRTRFVTPQKFADLRGMPLRVVLENFSVPVGDQLMVPKFLFHQPYKEKSTHAGQQAIDVGMRETQDVFADSTLSDPELYNILAEDDTLENKLADETLAALNSLHDSTMFVTKDVASSSAGIRLNGNSTRSSSLHSINGLSQGLGELEHQQSMGQDLSSDIRLNTSSSNGSAGELNLDELDSKLKEVTNESSLASGVLRSKKRGNRRQGDYSRGRVDRASFVDIPILASAFKRSIARALDTLILGAATLFIIQQVVKMAGLPLALGSMSINDPKTLIKLSLLVAIAIAGACLLEMLCLLALRTTPGKYLMGIKLYHKSGGKIKAWRLLQRTYAMWGRGLAAGIFPFPLISVFQQLVRLDQGYETTYDDNLNTRVVQASTSLSKRLPVVAVLALVLLAPVLYFQSNQEQGSIMQAAKMRIGELSQSLKGKTTAAEPAIQTVAAIEKTEAEAPSNVADNPALVTDATSASSDAALNSQAVARTKPQTGSEETAKDETQQTDTTKVAESEPSGKSTTQKKETAVATLSAVAGETKAEQIPGASATESNNSSVTLKLENQTPQSAAQPSSKVEVQAKIPEAVTVAADTNSKPAGSTTTTQAREFWENPVSGLLIELPPNWRVVERSSGSKQFLHSNGSLQMVLELVDSSATSGFSQPQLVNQRVNGLQLSGSPLTYDLGDTAVWEETGEATGEFYQLGVARKGSTVLVTIGSSDVKDGEANKALERLRAAVHASM